MKYPVVGYRNIEPLQDYYADGTGAEYSVARLIDDCKDLKKFKCPLAALDLAPQIWAGNSMYQLGFHVKKVMEADLSVPIILDWNGWIADGRHRVIKALAEGKSWVWAVRMDWKPIPCRRTDA